VSLAKLKNYEHSMNIQRWIGRRQPSWQALDETLKTLERRGLKNLPADQIRQLASLYRSVSADLARAKTNQVGEMIVRDLQALTTRAYAQIYQGSRKQEWKAVWEFFRWGFPAVVQRSRGYIALATSLFWFAALVGWWFAWRDPEFLAMIVPAQLIEMVRDRGELWMGQIVGVEPFASSSIMINNIKVTFATLIGGIYLPFFPWLWVGGTGTAYIMLFNGLSIGTIGTLVGQNNLAIPFWAFVFPHGSLELPAIFLAGGAGFLLSRALLFPGQYTRGDAFKVYGMQAAQIMFGVVPLLVIAGIIEGFFSPNPFVPDMVKYGVGTVLFIGLLVYLGQKRPVDLGRVDLERVDLGR
jgi:uncharacterized membrane protein SpoIIM required for sporulation